MRGRLLILACAAAAVLPACEKDTRVDRGERERKEPALRLVYATDGDPDETAEVLRRRLDALDDVDAEVRVDDDAIVIELGPGPEDAIDGVKRLVARRGGFAIHVVDPAPELMRALAERAAGEVTPEEETWYSRRLPPVTARYLSAPGRDALATFLADNADLEVPADRLLRIGPVDTVDARATGAPPWRTYVLHRQPALSSADVREVEVVRNQYSDRPEVVVAFADADRVVRVTRDNVDRKLAIVVDGDVLMAPVVRDPVQGGRISIDLGAGDPATLAREARELALVLKSGALPSTLRLQSQSFP